MSVDTQRKLNRSLKVIVVVVVVRTFIPKRKYNVLNGRLANKARHAMSAYVQKQEKENGPINYGNFLSDVCFFFSFSFSDPFKCYKSH